VSRGWGRWWSGRREGLAPPPPLPDAGTYSIPHPLKTKAVRIQKILAIWILKILAIWILKILAIWILRILAIWILKILAIWILKRQAY